MSMSCVYALYFFIKLPVVHNTLSAFLNSSSGSTWLCSLSKEWNKSINWTLFSLQYFASFWTGSNRGLGSLYPPVPPWDTLKWAWLSPISLISLSISRVMVIPSKSKHCKALFELPFTAFSRAKTPGGCMGFLLIWGGRHSRYTVKPV